MLFKRDTLQAIVDGKVTLAFRHWTRPSVREGTLLRTAMGVVRVTGVAAVSQVAVLDADARSAGFASRDAVLASLVSREGKLYRIGVAYEGADRRVTLRAKAPSRNEMDDVLQRLARMDASRETPWTARALQLIADNPSVRAADLAARMKRETRLFKTDVRKLKELGLTESLEIGYRLSPRGRAVLRRLRL